MRVGLVGGTFDPIHVGHLVVAASVHHALGLDETRLVVAADPWMKDPPAASATDRFAAVDAAVRDLGVNGIVADDIELGRDGPTYTIDTVEQWRSDDAGVEVFLALGFDAAAKLDRWHRIDALRDLVTLVLVNRAGAAEVAAPAGWRSEAVTIPPLDISSTEVRDRLRAGLPVDGMVPAAAMRELRKHGRYAGGR